MFAASFESKMGCLYYVFDVKKQGKPVWVVRARNWKLRGGENRLLGFLEGVSRGEGKEARGIEYNLCSSTEGTETFWEGFETFSMKVPKPCPKVSKPLVRILILPESPELAGWNGGLSCSQNELKFDL
ncbi:hypothetical protein GQ457_15G019200 [Hibiscus cannabinus]